MIKLNRFPGGRTHALTLSYDDGVKQDARLIDIMNAHGIKGAFHLNSGGFGRPEKIAEADIAASYAGHEISCHSLTHPHLPVLADTAVIHETLEDRKNLERCAGTIVRGMSYPFGSYDDRVIALLRACGIVYSRTVKSHGGFHLPENFLAWHPTCHHKHNLADVTARFLQTLENRWPTQNLLYVWGHSYEFDNDDNWDLIEKFCAQIGNNPRIWYATNIEIYDYVMAQRALQVSADGTLAHNPSAISVWVAVNDNPVEIAPGQTLLTKDAQ